MSLQFILGAAEFSNPLYDTSFTSGDDAQPHYATAYDGDGVIQNPAYGDLPVQGSGGYSEPVTGYSDVHPLGVNDNYSEPNMGYAEPSTYVEPMYTTASNQGVYMDVAAELEPDSVL